MGLKTALSEFDPQKVPFLVANLSIGMHDSKRPLKVKGPCSRGFHQNHYEPHPPWVFILGDRPASIIRESLPLSRLYNFLAPETKTRDWDSCPPCVNIIRVEIFQFFKDEIRQEKANRL